MIIDKHSYLEMGACTVPLRKDSHCSSMDYLDLTTDAISRTPEAAFRDISGSNFKPETVLDVHASNAIKATSLTISVPANLWHKRLAHPNVHVMTRVKHIAVCDTCKISKNTLQKHLKTSGPHPASARIKLVNIELLGPVMLKPIGGYVYMAQYTDHHIRVKATSVIEEPPTVLPTANSRGQ